MNVIPITEAELPYIALGVIVCLGFQLISYLLNFLIAICQKINLDNEVKWFKNREIKKQLAKEKADMKK